jgi:hypothetical protein
MSQDSLDILNFIGVLLMMIGFILVVGALLIPKG